MPSLLKGLKGAALALAASGVLLGQAVAQDNFTPAQREAIEGIIKDYLIRKPEVLQEAIAELEKKQAELQKKAQSAALAQIGAKLTGSGAGNVVGNPNGDVTLVEFFDYNCGYCKRALADLRTLIKSDGKLRIVLKDLPVLGPDSVEASKVALAVKQQLTGDKLFEYHSRLLETRGRVGGEQALKLARDMGLDVARVQKDMNGPEVRAAMAENADLGEKLAVNGTPAYIIGNEIIPGAVGAETLRQAIVSTRKCGQASC